MGKTFFFENVISNKCDDPGVTYGFDIGYFILKDYIIIRFIDMEWKWKKLWTELSYYRKNCFLIIYDITDSESFLFSTKVLVKEIQPLQNNRDFFIILIGSKCDLTEQRKVSYQEGKAFAEEYGCQFLEISCTKSINIKEFKEIFEEG